MQFCFCCWFTCALSFSAFEGVLWDVCTGFEFAVAFSLYYDRVILCLEVYYKADEKELRVIDLLF